MLDPRIFFSPASSLFAGLDVAIPIYLLGMWVWICHDGRNGTVLSEKWVTKGNFSYWIVYCDAVSTDSISPIFYIVGGICLVLWVVIVGVLCWYCGGNQVHPSLPPTLHLTSDPSLVPSSPSEQDLGLSQRGHTNADVDP